MTFTADPTERRTYDQVQGLELIVDGRGSDGLLEYKLVRSDGAVVRFTARQIRSAPETQHHGDGAAEDLVVHRVTSTRGRFPSRSRNLTDAIIRQALVAYRGGHGLPLHGDVVVHFDPR